MDSLYERENLVYGKGILVEGIEADKRIDVTARQTPQVAAFKKQKNARHNVLFKKKNK